MDALATSVVVAVFVFAGGMVGLHLHRVLPNTNSRRRDVIRLGTGMLSVLASLGYFRTDDCKAKTSFSSTSGRAGIRG